MSEKDTLINTLLSNGLAASRTEAQRMADDMITISNKVIDTRVFFIGLLNPLKYIPLNSKSYEG